MSLNFEQIGKPLALIKCPKKRDRIVYLDEKNEAKHTYDNIHLEGEETFQLIPDPEKERTIHYVCGSSGSGKSFFTASLANEYRKLHKENPIYIFSPLDDDSSIDRIKGAKRIKLTEEFVNTDLNENDFENSLMIYDDTDSVVEKKMKLKLRDLSLAILNRGRHTKTSIIMLNHLPYEGYSTKPILAEAHTITYFPATLGGKSRRYLLDTFLGLDKKQIERLGKIQSRSITVIKSYPMVMLAEKDIILLKSL
jgi:hypothetical protein